MKVLLICGSPHKEGCTHTALQEIADTLNVNGVETEEVWLGADPISGCRGCGACFKLGKCVIDDVVNEVAAKLDSADGLVLGSPVHFAAASGQVTSFADRLFFSHRGMAGKVGAAIVSCRRGGSTAAYDQLMKYIPFAGMYTAGSRYWNMVHGQSPEDVKQDLEGMYTMRVLARSMAYLLKCLEAGKAAGIPQPEQEPPVMTNFIR